MLTASCCICRNCLRLRGEALVQAGSADAEQTLRAALDEARRQEASAWELRAAISVWPASADPREG